MHGEVAAHKIKITKGGSIDKIFVIASKIMIIQHVKFTTINIFMVLFFFFI